MTRRERLERLRKRLVQRRDELRRTLSGNLGGAAGGKNGDEGDAATNHSADELDTQLASHLSGELKQVEAALGKFNDGTFGICEMTGIPVPIARLEALPYTRYSIQAQRLIEEEGYRPEDYAQDQGWARAVEHESRLSEGEGLARGVEITE